MHTPSRQTEDDLNVALATPTPPARRPAKPASRAQRRDWLTGYLFILPATVLIAIFGLFPIGYALYMSVFRWRIRKGAFIGLDNYADVLGNGWGALAFFGGLLLIMAAHWLRSDGVLWGHGVFNEDGIIDEADAIILGGNWGKTSASAGAAGEAATARAVPEASLAAVFLIGCLALLARRTGRYEQYAVR